MPFTLEYFNDQQDSPSDEKDMHGESTDPESHQTAKMFFFLSSSSSYLCTKRCPAHISEWGVVYSWSEWIERSNLCTERLHTWWALLSNMRHKQVAQDATLISVVSHVRHYPQNSTWLLTLIIKCMRKQWIPGSLSSPWRAWNEASIMIASYVEKCWFPWPSMIDLQ